MSRWIGGFFLAFDDYRFWLLYEEWRRFGTAREVDTWFLNRFYNALLADYGSAKTIFCSPFYWGPRAFCQGFYDDVKVYLPNCSMSARALLMMALAGFHITTGQG